MYSLYSLYNVHSVARGEQKQEAQHPLTGLRAVETDGRSCHGHYHAFRAARCDKTHILWRENRSTQFPVGWRVPRLARARSTAINLVDSWQRRDGQGRFRAHSRCCCQLKHSVRKPSA